MLHPIANLRIPARNFNFTIAKALPVDLPNNSEKIFPSIPIPNFKFRQKLLLL
jgi:hypothetical protein